jgi:hypothetical protein
MSFIGEYKYDQEEGYKYDLSSKKVSTIIKSVSISEDNTIREVPII